MTRTIKAEYMPGGERRQEMLDKAVDYIKTPGQTQQIKHEFCLTYLKMTENEAEFEKHEKLWEIKT